MIISEFNYNSASELRAISKYENFRLLHILRVKLVLELAQNTTFLFPHKTTSMQMPFVCNREH